MAGLAEPVGGEGGLALRSGCAQCHGGVRLQALEDQHMPAGSHHVPLCVPLSTWRGRWYRQERTGLDLELLLLERGIFLG